MIFDQDPVYVRSTSGFSGSAAVTTAAFEPTIGESDDEGKSACSSLEAIWQRERRYSHARPSGGRIWWSRVIVIRVRACQPVLQIYFSPQSELGPALPPASVAQVLPSCQKSREASWCRRLSAAALCSARCRESFVFRDQIQRHGS